MLLRVCFMLLRVCFLSLALASSLAAQPFEGPLVDTPPLTFTLRLPINPAPDQPRMTSRQWAEMGAVALTGVGHLAASEAGISAAYIPVVIGGWGGYIGYREATGEPFLRDLGFTSENLGPAFRDATILAGAATVGMIGIGAVQGTLRLEADMLPLLVLYPAWGLTQQMLVQGMITRHLGDAGVSPYAVTPVSAVAFGSVHVPNWELTAATTGLGLAYAELYRRHENLWPLGIYHGVLGAEFYVWVLGRNPWEEMFGGEAP
ncbi:MAG: CPBP family intramembrane glutamic endopeptidase [Bacteroidota bacterium]